MAAQDLKVANYLGLPKLAQNPPQDNHAAIPSVTLRRKSSKALKQLGTFTNFVGILLEPI
jgi:hypothetical protein